MLSKTRVALTWRFSRQLSMLPISESPNMGTVVPLQAKKPVIQASTLKNSARVAVSVDQSTTAVIKIGILGGSSKESQSEKGAAKVLACGAFDGNSTKFGVAMMRDFENIGAKVEATADREKIIHTIKVGNEHLSTALRLALENVKAPYTKNYMIDRAKHRAQIQYELFKHDPKAQLDELIHEAAYGENTPYGSSLYSYDLEGLKPADVINFHNTSFISENIAIAVQSNVSNVEQQIEAQLQGLASGKRNQSGYTFTGGEMRVRDMHLDDSYVALGFSGPAGTNGKACTVLRGLLRHKFSSRVSHIQHLVHRKLLHVHANDAWTGSFYHSYIGGRLFGMTFKGDAKYVTEGLLNVINELKQIATGNVSAEELLLVKTRLQLDASILGEGQGLANQMLRSMVTGNSQLLDELNYTGVQAKDVVSAAQTILRTLPAYAVLGRTYEVPTLNGILKMMA